MIGCENALLIKGWETALFDLFGKATETISAWR